MFVFAVLVHTLVAMISTTRCITLAAAMSGFLGVALGAFGAHGLKDTLEAGGSAETWKTAVLYQLVHAVALLALAGWRDAHGTAGGRVAGLWVVGIVLFSGSLYWLSLGGPRFLGPVTPLGGVAFLAGWLLLGWKAWQQPAA